MKFACENTHNVELAPGFVIKEYFAPNSGWPLEGAVAEINNGKLPWKINHDFNELVYVESGILHQTTASGTQDFYPGDMLLLEPGIPHQLYAEQAKLIIFCTPQFDPKNIEFCDNPACKC